MVNRTATISAPPRKTIAGNTNRDGRLIGFVGGYEEKEVTGEVTDL